MYDGSVWVDLSFLYTHPSTHSIDIITETSELKIMTSGERTKLSGISTNANLYVHPDTHAASMIDESVTRRFVSDTEKSIWNSKQADLVANSANIFSSESTDKLFVYKPLTQEFKAITKGDFLAGLSGGGGGEDQYVFVNKSQEFTATAGQSIFNLTTGQFNVGTERAKVYIWGNRQPKSAFTENSPTQIQLSQGVEVGTKVLIEWFEITNVMNYIHAANHATGGVDALTPANIGAEPSISEGTSSQYYGGDKTWQTLNKASVALGSVENYAIATQAEAQAGTSNVKYMTPLRAKEAISALATKTENSTTNGNIRVDGAEVVVYTHPASHSLDIITETAGLKVMTSAERTKLAGIATSANLYVHPNHSGDVTSVADGATTIANSAVTLAKMQNITTSSILGRVTASTGIVEVLTPANVRTIITDSSNRFLTDAERTTWNGKQNALGFTPENSANKGANNGYAPLDSTAKVPLVNLPDASKQQTYVVLNTTARNALTGLISGDKAFETATGDSYIWNGTSWLLFADADWANVNLEWTNIDGRPSSTVANIDSAVTQMHSHSNKATLDAIQQALTTTLKGNYDSAFSHISVTTNPHSVTKTQVGLGSVENYALATQAEAEAGTSAVKYMTPQRTSQAITILQAVKSVAGKTGVVTLVPADAGAEPAFTKNTGFNKAFGTTAGTVSEGNHAHATLYEPINANIQAHISSTANPHATTKAQVSLGSVENYGIATQAEAQAGTSNIKYTTPLRVAEAISQLQAVKSVAGKTGIVTLVKADVGLSNVEDKSSATIRGEITSSNVTTALGYTPTKKVTFNFGNGSAVQFDLTHNLGTKDINVVVYENATDEQMVADIKALNTTQVRINVAVAPTSNQYRAVIIG